MKIHTYIIDKLLFIKIMNKEKQIDQTRMYKTAVEILILSIY